jgi:hypothetical protein
MRQCGILSSRCSVEGTISTKPWSVAIEIEKLRVAPAIGVQKVVSLEAVYIQSSNGGTLFYGVALPGSLRDVICKRVAYLTLTNTINDQDGGQVESFSQFCRNCF